MWSTLKHGDLSNQPHFVHERLPGGVEVDRVLQSVGHAVLPHSAEVVPRVRSADYRRDRASSEINWQSARSVEIVLRRVHNKCAPVYERHLKLVEISDS